MKRLVVLGSGGRLGAAVARSFAPEYEVLGFNHSQLDLSSPIAVAAALAPIGFDALINCAALTNVDYCETHPEEARQVNAHAVGQIASICAKKRARLIHISTDYVFDGNKQTPYVEEDSAAPISVYGQSKRLGEIELLKAYPEAVAARVSWVFGPDRPSFLDAILKRAQQSEKVEAIADKFSSPTSAIDLAGWLREVLISQTTGILHLCNTGECSWREYGEYAIQQAIEAGYPMKAQSVAPLKLAEMKGFAAARPPYTVLSTGKFTTATGITPRSWQESVKEYVRSHCNFLGTKPA